VGDAHLEVTRRAAQANDYKINIGFVMKSTGTMRAQPSRRLRKSIAMPKHHTSGLQAVADSRTQKSLREVDENPGVAPPTSFRPPPLDGVRRDLAYDDELL